MSKIICDICGTKYPDTVEQCPICGYTNGAIAKSELEEEILEEVVREARPKTKGGRFSRENVNKNEDIRRKGKRLEEEEPEEDEDDYDEDDYEDDEDEDGEDEGKSGLVLNILLGVVIVALLCVSAFIFIRVFLPNFNAAQATEPPTEAYVDTLPTETDAPTVPCTELVMAESEVELTEIGQLYLLNVSVHPEDTTDELAFTSSDENVVTVNAEGRVTAVADGIAVVTISCGDQKIECTVKVTTVQETEGPTEEPTEPGVKKTVTNAFVNIRKEPGTDSEKVGEYKQGDVVIIYEEKTVGGRPWGRTDKGWICTEYVQ